MDTSCKSGFRLTNVGQSFGNLGKINNLLDSKSQDEQIKKLQGSSDDNLRRSSEEISKREEMYALVSPSTAASADFPESRAAAAFRQSITVQGQSMKVASKGLFTYYVSRRRGGRGYGKC